MESLNAGLICLSLQSRWHVALVRDSSQQQTWGIQPCFVRPGASGLHICVGGLRGLLGEEKFGRLQRERTETHLAERGRGRQNLSRLRFHAHVLHPDWRLLSAVYTGLRVEMILNVFTHTSTFNLNSCRRDLGLESSSAAFYLWRSTLILR